MKRLKRLHFISLLMVLLFAASACSTGGGGTAFDICSAVSVVQTQQSLVESAAGTMIALAATNSIPADVLAKAKQAYTLWETAQAPVVTALVAINDSGGNPTAISLQQYMQLMIQTAVLVAQFIAIYNSTKAPALSADRMSVARAAAAGCTMTDEQITSALAVKTWAQLGGQ